VNAEAYLVGVLATVEGCLQHTRSTSARSLALAVLSGIPVVDPPDLRGCTPSDARHSVVRISVVATGLGPGGWLLTGPIGTDPCQRPPEDGRGAQRRAGVVR
jgi:hypothetical protein